MSHAGIKTDWRRRNQKRAALQQRLSRGRKRGWPVGVMKALQRQLDAVPLALCSKCGESYKSHSRGECIAAQKS